MSDRFLCDTGVILSATTAGYPHHSKSRDFLEAP